MLHLVLCIISCGCIDKIQVSPKTHSFVDKLGQTHIFHGTAADNNFGLIHYDEIQLTQLKDWGFNVMRLGFHWHLYEYAPNMYNESYMNSIETLVNTFYEYGIMTILDMHQDLWSPLFCGGHGIPEFYSYPYNDTESYWKYNNLTYPYPHHAPRGYVDNDEWFVNYSGCFFFVFFFLFCYPCTKLLFFVLFCFVLFCFVCSIKTSTILNQISVLTCIQVQCIW